VRFGDKIGIRCFGKFQRFSKENILGLIFPRLILESLRDKFCDSNIPLNKVYICGSYQARGGGKI
jgi:hypothetical protein